MAEHNPDSLSQISHRLRTPLTVIISSVHNLLDGAFGPLNKEQKKWLQKLVVHTKSLETISNEILSLLKNDEGEMKLKEMKNTTHAGTTIPAPAFMRPDISKMQHAPVILVVDDEHDILDIVQEGMGMKGYKALTADNGEDAVKLAREQNPDMVLMDVHLDQQNGVEVCKKIKSLNKSYIPILMMTGNNELEDKLLQSDNAPDDILMKPFQMEELFSRVHSMLRIKSLYDELARCRQGKAA